MKNNEVWVMVSRLFLVGLVAALALAGTYALTEKRIEAQAAQALVESKQAVLPLASAFVDMPARSGDGIVAVYAGLDAQAELVGHVLTLEGKGYGGPLVIMVGLDTQGKVMGVRIQKHSETAGLGARVDNEGYLEQYKGKGVGLMLKQDIDAVTGATISSTTVLKLVNIATAWAAAR